MAKRKGNKPSKPNSGSQVLTLRQESSGKKPTKSSHNVNHILKMQHLENLAKWAGQVASIPPLAALYGRNLAANSEALDVPINSSLFSCARCETILQPGFNCTIRAQKNSLKIRDCKALVAPKNNVVYKCHFCLHQNLNMGTPKYYMKEVVSLKPKHDFASKEVIEASGAVETSAPKTPMDRMLVAHSKETENEKGTGFIQLMSSSGNEERNNASRKRKRRKSWSTLKEITEKSRERSNNMNNLTIPFFL